MIELLVATALAALLLAAVLGVARMMSEQRKAVLAIRPPEAWQTQLVEQLRWDLSNSRQMEASGERLLLRGYASHDARTGSPVHRPAEVIYRVVREAGRSWLLREEAFLAETVRTKSKRDLVASNVDRLEWDWVDRFDVRFHAGGEPDPKRGLEFGGRLSRRPPELKVVLRTSDGSVVLSRVIRVY